MRLWLWEIAGAIVLLMALLGILVNWTIKVAENLADRLLFALTLCGVLLVCLLYAALMAFGSSDATATWR